VVLGGGGWVGGQFVLPNIQTSVKFGDFEELYKGDLVVPIFLQQEQRSITRERCSAKAMLLLPALCLASFI